VCPPLLEEENEGDVRGEKPGLGEGMESEGREGRIEGGDEGRHNVVRLHPRL